MLMKFHIQHACYIRSIRRNVLRACTDSTPNLLLLCVVASVHPTCNTLHIADRHYVSLKPTFLCHPLSVLLVLPINNEEKRKTMSHITLWKNNKI
jgi:hypothetical protein